MTKKSAFVAAGLVGLAVCYSFVGAQGTVGISPGNATMLVGQNQQFTMTGTVRPAAITSGAWHTCILFSDRSVRCTGRNNQGQIGDGSFNNASRPVLVGGLPNPVTLRAGNEHTCTLMADGTMRCWGTNYTGQLGDGTIGGYALVPQPVNGISNAVAAVTGGFHTCAILSDNTVKCWGRNQDGQIGNGDSTTDVTQPVPVSGLGIVAGMAGGGYHTCTNMPDRTMRCWGRNGRGQVGDGTVTSRSTPAVVSGMTNAAAINPGGYHTCAVLMDGRVQCWGESDFGQIGSPVEFSSVPLTVAGLSSAVAVASGWRHSCAILADGRVRCWGNNEFGQLGNGGTTNTNSPVDLQGITAPRAMAAGAGHTCALMGDFSVRCVGENDFGQLGNGTMVNSFVPVAVDGTAIQWSSSDPTVATISATGRVTALAEGTTTIVGTDSAGNTASTVVTVTTQGSLAALSVTLAGRGMGTVNSNPEGIACGTDCSETYLNGSAITLTAIPAAGSTLTGWSGCDVVSGLTCTVTMNASRSVTPTFERIYTLTVTKTGVGTGTVASSPAGINCGTACSAAYLDGTTVTLTATPSMLSVFIGWTGCDSSSDTTCTVNMSSAKTITAEFLGVPMD